MKLPERVKIGPYKYSVHAKKKVRKDGRDLYGYIAYGPQKIEVQSGLSDERTSAIFLHEALHGLSDAYSINLSEKQVTKLGVALAEFLTENDLLKGSADTEN